MRFLGRAVLLFFGLLLAIPAGLLTMTIGVAFEPAAQDLIAAFGAAGFEAMVTDFWREGSGAFAAEGVLLGLWALSATIFVMPPALVGVIGEVLGIRSFVWYGFGCGALMAALPWLGRGSERLADGNALAAEGRITALLFITGAVAALTYWLVAGRSPGSP